MGPVLVVKAIEAGIPARGEEPLQVAAAAQVRLVETAQQLRGAMAAQVLLRR